MRIAVPDRCFVRPFALSATATSFGFDRPANAERLARRITDGRGRIAREHIRTLCALSGLLVIAYVGAPP